MKSQIIKIISILLVSTAAVGVPVFILSPGEKHTEQTTATGTASSHETVTPAPSTIPTEKEETQADVDEDADEDVAQASMSEDTSAAITITRKSGKITVKTTAKTTTVEQSVKETNSAKKYESEINELITKYTNIYVAALDYLENGGDPTGNSDPSESSEPSEPSESSEQLEQPGMGVSRYCTSERCVNAKKLELDATKKANSLQEMKGTLKESASTLKESVDFYGKEQDVANNLKDLRALLELFNNLIEKYQSAIDSYSEEATAARLAKEAAIADEIARLNGSVSVAVTFVNTYPYQGDCPHRNLAYSTQWGYVCQATSYAGYKAYEHWNVYIAYWGNAYSWDESAVARGYRVDRNPAPYTIAVSNSGAWGHVMWVESVNADGTINLSEYNNSYSAASHLPGDYGYRVDVSPAGLYFIHFD